MIVVKEIIDGEEGLKADHMKRWKRDKKKRDWDGVF
jgi:hypothetical protein